MGQQTFGGPEVSVAGELGVRLMWVADGMLEEHRAERSTGCASPRWMGRSGLHPLSPATIDPCIP